MFDPLRRRDDEYYGQSSSGWSNWQERLLPQTVLGISLLILAFAIGAGFSGAIFDTYYEFKKESTEQRVNAFIETFEKRVDAATKAIEAERRNAQTGLEQSRARPQVNDVDEVLKKVQPSVFFVNTLDDAGQAAVGSAFAVASDAQQTLLLTSYTTVKAATRLPGPPVNVRKGNEDIPATVWTWQEEKDLALLILPRGGVPKIPFAPRDPPLKPGDKVFAVSGLGAAGAAISQGSVADVSSAGIQHDAAVGQPFQGGPLVNGAGAVVGVASRSYAPLGFAADGVFFAPLIRSACEKVLRCPAGEVEGSGERTVPVPTTRPSTARAPSPTPAPTTATTARP